MTASPTFRRFVAIGDSTTEGLDDPTPAGGYRGWADRLAGLLAARDPAAGYANLAVRGRYAHQVRAEQLAPALTQRPDLISVIAGVNDVLRARFDLSGILGELDTMFSRAAASGATVLTITQPDPVAVLRMARPIRGRLRAYNAGVRALAARHGAVLVDFARIPSATHPVYWSTDRLHLNARGHAAMAATMAATLGMPVRLPDQPDPVGAPGRGAALAEDVRWLGEYFVPWVWRLARGRSVGDGMVAKRPALAPVHGSGPPTF
jgi:lysophospholipase L1-like esterase